MKRKQRKLRKPKKGLLWNKRLATLSLCLVGHALSGPKSEFKMVMGCVGHVRWTLSWMQKCVYVRACGCRVQICLSVWDRLQHVSCVPLSFCADIFHFCLHPYISVLYLWFAFIASLALLLFSLLWCWWCLRAFPLHPFFVILCIACVLSKNNWWIICFLRLIAHYSFCVMGDLLP